jgi:hypothetical protein
MDYKNGKIYRVVCSETNRQYIGSTTSTLVKRLHQHKYKKDCMCKDFIEPKIFLIEDFPCDRKDQLLMRERYFIESMECVNLYRPIVTKEEVLKERKEYNDNNKEKRKEYRENNKELIREKEKLNYEKNTKNK